MKIRDENTNHHVTQEKREKRTWRGTVVPENLTIYDTEIQKYGLVLLCCKNYRHNSFLR